MSTSEWLEDLRDRVAEAIADEPRDSARVEKLELELREVRVENKRLWSLLDILEKLHREIGKP